MAVGNDGIRLTEGAIEVNKCCLLKQTRRH